jgi:hypothetical protein
MEIGLTSLEDIATNRSSSLYSNHSLSLILSFTNHSGFSFFTFIYFYLLLFTFIYFYLLLFTFHFTLISYSFTFTYTYIHSHSLTFTYTHTHLSPPFTYFSPRVDTELRQTAIQIICDSLLTIRGMEEKIQNYANLSLTSLKEYHTQSEDEIKMQNSLYFSLIRLAVLPLRGVLEIFPHITEDVRKILHRQCVEFVKAHPLTENTLLSLITDPPDKAESLIRTILHISTESGPPLSERVIHEVQLLYRRKDNDVRFLVPIVCYLSRDELFEFLPAAVAQLPLDAMKLAIMRLLKANALVCPLPQLLCQLIVIADEKKVEKCIPVINFCLDETDAFSSEMMAVVLEKLVETSPWPILLMRVVCFYYFYFSSNLSFSFALSLSFFFFFFAPFFLLFSLHPLSLPQLQTKSSPKSAQVIQITDKYPKLVGFVIELLSRKKVWVDSRLWQGFARFCKVCFAFFSSFFFLLSSFFFFFLVFYQFFFTLFLSLSFFLSPSPPFSSPQQITLPLPPTPHREEAPNR